MLVDEFQKKVVSIDDDYRNCVCMDKQIKVSVICVCINLQLKTYSLLL